MDLDEVLAVTFSLITPHLTERQRRLLFGAAARALGYGGVSPVARLAEASRPTVRRGAAELGQAADPRGRIRQHDGPKRLRERDPGLLQALDRLASRWATRSWRRCRLRGMGSTASGTTPCTRRQRRHHRRQGDQARPPEPEVTPLRQRLQRLVVRQDVPRADP